MPEHFDPYHIWLGIAHKDQPPNHYRLLGIDAFESNRDVISSAADRQMAHVRSASTGKHVELTQKLLNEISAARICLLASEKKSAYDNQLRATLAEGKSLPLGESASPAMSVSLSEAAPSDAQRTSVSIPTVSKSNATSRRSTKNGGLKTKRMVVGAIVGVGLATVIVIFLGVGLLGSASP